MSTDFQTVAKKVVNDSIRHAVYVDDDIVMPYGRGKKQIKDLCKGLYDSFRKNNCSLDFYQYKSRKKLSNSSELFFKRKDLLILDWKLKPAREWAQTDTLFLIDEAVNTDSLHYVCLFTDEADIESIIYRIAGYFSGINSHQKIAFENWVSTTEQEGLEINDIFDANRGLLRELSLRPQKKGEAFSSVKKAFGTNFPLLQTFVRTNFPEEKKLPNSIEKVAFLSEKVELRRDSDTKFSVRVFIDGKFIRINHTLIFVIGKGDIEPNKDLFGKITSALLKCSESQFLTVMGLEFRNAILEQSGFVGKDLNSITEDALFHHQETAEPKEEFYDFLKNLWNSTVFEPLHRKVFEVFKILEEYKASRTNSKSPDTKDLAQLNYYYNKSSVVRKDEMKIYFGNIFQIQGEGTLNGQFLLCITPTCDCLRPDKIHGNFYFVKGCKTNLGAAVERGDTDYDSYIRLNDEVICIQWQTKPFTIFIKEADNKTSQNIPIITGGVEYKLKHVESIKENYAQRIANYSFSYPLRVGILFVNSKEYPKVDLECMDTADVE